MFKIVKIGNVELLEREAKDFFHNNKFIVTYSKIYSVNYSEAQKSYYGAVVYSKPANDGIGLATRGRWFCTDASGVNNLLNFELLK